MNTETAMHKGGSVHYSLESEKFTEKLILQEYTVILFPAFYSSNH